jgi:DNA helicase-2/ATP-dependent DNA helicase PcrA
MDSIGVGDKIYHKRFKEGTILEKSGDSINIRFSDGDRVLNSKVCLTKRIIWKI